MRRGEGKRTGGDESQHESARARVAKIERLKNAIEGESTRNRKSSRVFSERDGVATTASNGVIRSSTTVPEGGVKNPYSCASLCRVCRVEYQPYTNTSRIDIEDCRVCRVCRVVHSPRMEFGLNRFSAALNGSQATVLFVPIFCSVRGVALWTYRGQACKPCKPA